MDMIEDFKKQLNSVQKLSKLRMEYVVDLAYKFVEKYSLKRIELRLKVIN